MYIYIYIIEIIIMGSSNKHKVLVISLLDAGGGGDKTLNSSEWHTTCMYNVSFYFNFIFIIIKVFLYFVILL